MNRLDQLIIAQAYETGWQPDQPAYVVDDPTGSLLAHLLDNASTVTVLSDSHSQVHDACDYATRNGQRQKLCARGIDGPLELNAFLQSTVEPEASHGVVVTRLPKSRTHLDYLAHCTARAGVGAFVGAHNTKHMTRAQNQILATYYATEHASRGSGKFRALCATKPLPNLPEPQPHHAGHLYAIGATFAGSQADHGGQLLATTAIADWATPPRTILDFGCGNGAVSYLVAQHNPATTIIATDISADAVTSTQLTLVPYRERTTVTWDTSARSIAENDVDAVLLNPPFHDGFSIDDTLVDELLAAAQRVLKPGGAIYVVYNSHLRYRLRIGQLFTDVVQLARDSRFTIVRGHKL
ncbi:16S rRNA (guanine1207-N2)-methyltransferase [Arcanobacterium phocae]|uniref:16S rRNA (Guanine1207-N2)-methyltransferase n=1 Tax=Arcanobacterium phocae TaxID=131112 RepID=A0A1H2LEY9_9ACTO|nr:methyltransferase [Arcanobacterium phocae]SDU78976.1 16S rRNA (guanine1207-N2)-methyltransferase [Arcanobacterium phocae]